MRNNVENSYYGYPISCEELIIGNNADLCVNKDDCEVKVNIGVKRLNTVRLWGQVLDCDGYPVANALVKLLKFTNQNGVCNYEGVAHTISDCNGFYQFDVPSTCAAVKYKILVSKSAYGNEKVVAHPNCNPCNPKPPMDFCNKCNNPQAPKEPIPCTTCKEPLKPNCNCNQSPPKQKHCDYSNMQDSKYYSYYYPEQDTL